MHAPIQIFDINHYGRLFGNDLKTLRHRNAKILFQEFNHLQNHHQVAVTTVFVLSQQNMFVFIYLYTYV